jgi:hypothetical protein
VVVGLAVVISLVGLWLVLTLVADDGCAWIAGFGGCR